MRRERPPLTGTAATVSVRGRAAPAGPRPGRRPRPRRKRGGGCSLEQLRVEVSGQRRERLHQARAGARDDVGVNHVDAVVLYGGDAPPTGAGLHRFGALSGVLIGQDDDVRVGLYDRLGAHLGIRLPCDVGDVGGAEHAVQVADERPRPGAEVVVIDLVEDRGRLRLVFQAKLYILDGALHGGDERGRVVRVAGGLPQKRHLVVDALYGLGGGQVQDRDVYRLERGLEVAGVEEDDDEVRLQAGDLLDAGGEGVHLGELVRRAGAIGGVVDGRHLIAGADRVQGISVASGEGEDALRRLLQRDGVVYAVRNLHRE